MHWRSIDQNFLRYSNESPYLYGEFLFQISLHMYLLPTVNTCFFHFLSLICDHLVIIIKRGKIVGVVVLLIKKKITGAVWKFKTSNFEIVPVHLLSAWKLFFLLFFYSNLLTLQWLDDHAALPKHDGNGK